jgi:hypothetical protein
MDLISLRDQFLHAFQTRFVPVDVIGTCASSLPILAAAIAIDDPADHVNCLSLSGGVHVRRQFDFDHRLLLLVLDEKTRIVGTAEKGGLTAKTEADGAKDSGLARAIGTYHDVKSDNGADGM